SATSFNTAYAAGTTADDALDKAHKWADSKFAQFVQGNKALIEEVQAANKERASWAAYSEDYKKWTPDEAEKHKPGYAYCEYVWSVKKDKDFRTKHTTSAVAGVLKEFQNASGGVVSEFFVTDAKGGN